MNLLSNSEHLSNGPVLRLGWCEGRCQQERAEAGCLGAGSGPGAPGSFPGQVADLPGASAPAERVRPAPHTGQPAVVIRTLGVLVIVMLEKVLPVELAVDDRFVVSDPRKLAGAGRSIYLEL